MSLLDMDAWGKIPSHVLSGNTQWYGAYEECQDIPSSHYCLAGMVLFDKVLTFSYTQI